MNKNFNIGPSNQRERNRFEPHSISFDILQLIYQFFNVENARFFVLSGFEDFSGTSTDIFREFEV